MSSSAVTPPLPSHHHPLPFAPRLVFEQEAGRSGVQHLEQIGERRASPCRQSTSSASPAAAGPPSPPRRRQPRDLVFLAEVAADGSRARPRFLASPLSGAATSLPSLATRSGWRDPTTSGSSRSSPSPATTVSPLDPAMPVVVFKQENGVVRRRADRPGELPVGHRSWPHADAGRRPPNVYPTLACSFS
ncbi:hypothetical protein E2562_036683 [Oryza meyeriana var. granulata]|uniref:Uncharacterized protein n=1 Tax=Oryza meyeriana var. granulata TaxID=110450 RepID=A0A6G1DSN1_9ORYZ|nr:hypothetical protein E2562_036683 [Oryza meyeriana var. granulata]